MLMVKLKKMKNKQNNCEKRGIQPFDSAQDEGRQDAEFENLLKNPR